MSLSQGALHCLNSILPHAGKHVNIMPWTLPRANDSKTMPCARQSIVSSIGAQGESWGAVAPFKFFKYQYSGKQVNLGAKRVVFREQFFVPYLSQKVTHTTVQLHDILYMGLHWNILSAPPKTITNSPQNAASPTNNIQGGPKITERHTSGNNCK